MLCEQARCSITSKPLAIKVLGVKQQWHEKRVNPVIPPAAQSVAAMELELFAAIGRTIQNTSPIFQGRYKQFPDYGEAQRAVVHQRLERMDRELNGREFVAGDRFTIADITALVAIDIGGRLADIKVAPELSNLSRWHKAVSSRPSAK